MNQYFVLKINFNRFLILRKRYINLILKHLVIFGLLFEGKSSLVKELKLGLQKIDEYFKSVALVKLMGLFLK